jgi:hypothetical protein
VTYFWGWLRFALSGCSGDVGYVLRHCLPTYRGYDTFLGYYTACTADYWMHGAPGAGPALGPCNDVDFHDSKATNIAGAAMSGRDSLNNTYDQVVFTQRAVQYIHAQAKLSAPLFLYLAYHNVHDACQTDRFKAGACVCLFATQAIVTNRPAAGLNAPLETVERYATTTLDTWKVQVRSHGSLSSVIMANPSV